MHHIHFTPRRRAAASRFTPKRRQGGVIMIITLIALVILMIGGVALVRSFDTSMLMSGNLAFKRDLMNQGERGMARAITALSSTISEAAKQNDSTVNNYSATTLPSDVHGIPTALFASTFASTYTAGDITDGAVSIRYVIDRQCALIGPFSADQCTSTATTTRDKSGSSQLASKKPGGGTRPVYRISVRVTGPRNTQAYLQSTVTL